MKTTQRKQALDQYELEKLVGSSAAFMLFGQGGACIGRTFKLTSRRGRTITVKMTDAGALVDGDTKQINDDENEEN